jgi:hypothetical protein
MHKKIRSFHILLSSFIIGLLYISSSFAKSVKNHKFFLIPEPARVSANEFAGSSKILPAKSVYDSLHLNFSGLSLAAFNFAKAGFNKLIEEGQLLNDSIITIIDFSMPSYKKRFFVIDLKNYKILFNTLVAHGRNSGKVWANSFSNRGSSYKSSPGFYITKETYFGKNGYSLKLDGVEKGINDKAYDRGIVIHGAEYVNQNLAAAQGYIGRSQGCPAVPLQISRSVINAIKSGTCVFIYHPSYIHNSSVLG